MAETVNARGIAQPSALGAQGTFDFQFTLDGMATSKQMEKLLKLNSDLVKKIVGPDADSLKNFSDGLDAAGKKFDKIRVDTDNLSAAQENYEARLHKAEGFLASVLRGNY